MYDVRRTPLGQPLSILVVTTCWWSSLARLAQLLQRAGCKVAVLAPPGHPAAVVPGIADIRYDPLRPMRALTHAITQSGADIVVPGDDRALAHLHRLHATGTAHEKSVVERSLGTPLFYDVLRSRLGFSAAARACGLRVPEDTSLETEADLRRWCARVPAPWVFKSDGAWSGRGVRIVSTEAEAATAFRELRKGVPLGKVIKGAVIDGDLFWAGDWLRQRRPPSVSAQAYIPGRPGNLAVFCTNGRVEAFSAVVSEACFDPTGPSVLIRTIDAPALRDGIARLASYLGLSGFHGVDFILDERDSQPALIEMNARATPLANLRLGADHDLVGAAIQAWSGHPASLPPSEPTDRLIAHFPLCWHWNAEDPRLPECYADIPYEEPALLRAMLAYSWPERRLFARWLARLRGDRTPDRAERLLPRLAPSMAVEASQARAVRETDPVAI